MKHITHKKKKRAKILVDLLTNGQITKADVDA